MGDAQSAGAVGASRRENPGEESGKLEAWWNGKGATGDWLGVRETMEDHGLVLSGKWLGTVYGVMGGGLEHRATFDEELKFDAKLDFANNCLPFFFYTGLVYGGLIPTRDRDQAGVAFALGNYSYYQILSNREEGNEIVDTFEGVLEFECRVQVNKWSYVRPFLQYVIRPGGDGQVANATVLGVLSELSSDRETPPFQTDKGGVTAWDSNSHCPHPGQTIPVFGHRHLHRAD